MLTGRLNVFQRLARTWDGVHPYNAGQACRVAGAFDADAVDRSWDASLRALGLGTVTSDGTRFSFQPVPERAVQWLAPDTGLDRHFTTELNRPFDDATEPPFRPFVQSAGGSTWLGIVYQHWVADSHSIRLLMCDWVSRLLGIGAPRARSTPPAGRAPCDTAALELLRRYGQFRRCRKVHTMGPLDHAVRVRLLPKLTSVVPGLRAFARTHGVTVNDLFLAALAQACGQLVPTQSRPGRRDLAVSSVVDLRRARTSVDAFGCMLGFRSIVCRSGDLGDGRRLLRSVAAQRTRSNGLLWMLAAEWASRLTPPQRVYDFYRKEAPFVGGISNVNLNGTWFARRHPSPVLDYTRVSPTGPMVPVAMNVTTLGDDLHLSMTYRTALFNDWTAAELAQAFVRRIACP